MEFETREERGGTVIETEEDAAVVVNGSEGERIFLPGVSGSDSSYYVEEGGKEFFYGGEIEEIEVIR
ncbi:MAG: hypothetical protein ABEJ98_01730 [Candidatus Nanohaloarchaea archaeon]